MKASLKSIVKWIIIKIVAFLEKTAIGRYTYNIIINTAMDRVQSVSHQKTNLLFSVPNALNKYRASSFSTKEPETLEWIDRIPKGSVLWDVGANVGIYSCYAAKQRNCRVFSFEPSVFNLELLARNIFLNGLTDKITIVPLALSDGMMVSNFNMTMTDWGGAMSTFKEDYGHDGLKLDSIFKFSTIGLTMSDAVTLLKIPAPDHIKMDVDGIEHLILKEGIPILQTAKSVLIEINDEFAKQNTDAKMYLENAGYTLKEKRHAEYFDHVTTAAKHTYNQIWVNETSK